MSQVPRVLHRFQSLKCGREFLICSETETFEKMQPDAQGRRLGVKERAQSVSLPWAAVAERRLAAGQRPHRITRGHVGIVRSDAGPDVQENQIYKSINTPAGRWEDRTGEGQHPSKIHFTHSASITHSRHLLAAHL
ncbi:hypothetical protein SKAU_G00302860 [Synaphobranchus kaupii]|uniref:Uncharacterized protein n=1 Tax=Synaphobranchus kaupii TaxID=118154 RepID=A0A9Q1INF9_SYNKA|nr:hypothetical protein SKAU_G00302860 [Synaphobranchus kaupii]